jgi:hypothetical protein
MKVVARSMIFFSLIVLSACAFSPVSFMFTMPAALSTCQDITIMRMSREDNEATNSNPQDSGSKEQPLVKPVNPASTSSSQPPSPQLLMRALNTSPRRLFLGSLSASAIALTGNFCGVTSILLDKFPEDSVESTGLDQYYPRGNFKRFKSGEFGYTLVVPKEWVQDTAVELAKIQKRAGNLDYSMRIGTKSPAGVGGGSVPDVAYGPTGAFTERGISQSDTNLSTIATKLRPGLTLKKSLGSPSDAAETLLRVSLAPEGSGRIATLLGAREETRGAGQIYTFEYKVDRGNKGVPLRAISNIAAQGGDTLITMTVVAPEKEWFGDYEVKLRKTAESFKVIR